MAQSLTEWLGDVESLLTEMKRRARVNTDSELAEVLSTTQSNVSTWRKRGAVPKAALLRFERLNIEDATPTHRTMAARAIAIRAAEFAHQRAGGRGGASRTVLYGVVAGAWDTVVAAIAADLKRKEATTKLWPLQLAEGVMENEEYLAGIADWIASLSSTEVLKALALAPDKAPRSNEE